MRSSWNFHSNSQNAFSEKFSVMRKFFVSSIGLNQKSTNCESQPMLNANREAACSSQNAWTNRHHRKKRKCIVFRQLVEIQFFTFDEPPILVSFRRQERNFVPIKFND